jgi:hypothetical protein
MTKRQELIDTIFLAMKTLLNPADRDEILRRLSSLRADSQRHWGRMSAGQMICHLSDSFRSALGEKSVSSATTLYSRTVTKWIALRLNEWPHGVRTRPEVDQERGGTPPAEFGADVQQLKVLFDRFCDTQQFSDHPTMGPPVAYRTYALGLPAHEPSPAPVRSLTGNFRMNFSGASIHSCPSSKSAT